MCVLTAHQCLKSSQTYAESAIIHIMESEKIILDKENRQIYIQKILTEYNTDVYRYLHEQRNVHIPYVKEFHEEDGRLVVTEEFIQGHTLDELLTAENRGSVPVKAKSAGLDDTEENSGQNVPYSLTAADKENILNGILDAVEFLHSATPPIIHRDIKPSNIMITADGIVKLIDYDAAKIKHKDESHDTVYLGTHGSAAPEQYGFGSSDERTDIYAIGILIKELFPENRHYLKIAETATNLDPDDRYQSIKELKRALKGRWIVPFHVNIPGFRSGNIFHMILSLFIYFILIGGVTGFTTDGVSKDERIYYQIVCTGMIFSWIDIWMLWTPFFKVVIPVRSRHMITRICTKLVLSVLSFIFWLIVLLVMMDIAGL